MSYAVHIHDDDLELYSAGHLEPERVTALESHLSGCQDCQERLQQCIGPQLRGLPLANNHDGIMPEDLKRNG